MAAVTCICYLHYKKKNQQLHFSINVLAFYHEFLSIFSIVDGAWLGSIRFLTKWWTLLCIFELSVKRI